MMIMIKSVHLPLGVITKEKPTDKQLEQILENSEMSIMHSVVGGRWANYIMTKSNERTNSAKIADIQFAPDEDVIKELEYVWNKVVVEMDEEHTIFPPPPTKEFLVETYETKENYVNAEGLFSTYAYLLPSNEWIQPGPLNVYGESVDSPESRQTFIQKRNAAIDEFQDYYLTIVDCQMSCE